MTNLIKRDTTKSQLERLGVALKILDSKPEVKKDKKGRVLDTDNTRPKLNVKSRKVYKKRKRPQHSESTLGAKFFDFIENNLIGGKD